MLFQNWRIIEKRGSLMKRAVFMLFIVLFLRTYGCNTMKAIEDDMASLLEHMESGRLSSESSENGNQADSRDGAPGVFSSQPSGNVKQSKNKYHSLTIRVFPEDCTVKVMNIRSRYYPDITDLSLHFASVRTGVCWHPAAMTQSLSSGKWIKIA